FFSIGLFAAQVALLPYNMFMDPPWEAEYDLGYYRPGDKVPTDVYYLPLTGVGPPLHGSNYGVPPTPSRWGGGVRRRTPKAHDPRHPRAGRPPGGVVFSAPGARGLLRLRGEARGRLVCNRSSENMKFSCNERFRHCPSLPVALSLKLGPRG